MDLVEEAEKLAVCAARSAGDLLRKYWKSDEDLDVEFKSTTDVVTKADKAAEKLIISILSSFSTPCGFLCEESGLSESGKGSEYRWIVDPLDGTTSFTHKVSSL